MENVNYAKVEEFKETFWINEDSNYTASTKVFKEDNGLITIEFTSVEFNEEDKNIGVKTSREEVNSEEEMNSMIYEFYNNFNVFRIMNVLKMMSYLVKVANERSLEYLELNKDICDNFYNLKYMNNRLNEEYNKIRKSYLARRKVIDGQ